MEHSSFLITNAKIYTPQPLKQPGWVLIENKKITHIGTMSGPIPSADKKLDADGMILAPGFIDGHVHGAMGHETMDAEPEGLIAMAEFYAKHGVTSFLPTTWAAPMETLVPVLNNVKETMNQEYNGAQILGAHIEGPFICPHKAGAQNPDFIFPATPEMAQFLIDQQIVKLMTMAPEIPENLAVIPTLTKAGIAVSAGHTQATYEEMATAVEHGVTSVTHTFNAMPPLHHRNPGAVGAALTIDELYTEVIADKIHLHPAILKLVVNSKPEDRLLLVSDAIRGTGLEDGIYPIDNREIFIKDGVARLESGNLAGSTLTLDKALQNMLSVSEKPLEAILPALTTNPAHLLGVVETKGKVQAGYDADLVLLSPAFEVLHTIINGVLF